MQLKVIVNGQTYIGRVMKEKTAEEAANIFYNGMDHNTTGFTMVCKDGSVIVLGAQAAQNAVLVFLP
jgi:hypothetical protein